MWALINLSCGSCGVRTLGAGRWIAESQSNQGTLLTKFIPKGFGMSAAAAYCLCPPPLVHNECTVQNSLESGTQFVFSVLFFRVLLIFFMSFSYSAASWSKAGEESAIPKGACLNFLHSCCEIERITAAPQGKGALFSKDPIIKAPPLHRITDARRTKKPFFTSPANPSRCVCVCVKLRRWHTKVCCTRLRGHASSTRMDVASHGKNPWRKRTCTSARSARRL